MFRKAFCPSSGALLNCSRSLRFPYRSQGGCVSCCGLFVSLTNKSPSLRFPYTSQGGCVSCRGLFVSLTNKSRSLRFPYRSQGGCVSCCGLLVSLTNKPRQETHPPWLLYGNRRLRLQFKSSPDDGQNVARNMLSSV
jgi:hypothetical protein